MTDIVTAIEDALDASVGMHSAFVIAAESYDSDTGEPRIHVAHNGPNAWTKLGLARALTIDLEAGFHEWSDEGGGSDE